MARSTWAISVLSTRGWVKRGQTSSGEKPARRSSWASQASNALASRPDWVVACAVIGTVSSSLSVSRSGS